MKSTSEAKQDVPHLYHSCRLFGGCYVWACRYVLAGHYPKVMQENGDWHYQITSIDTKTSDLIAARPEVEVSGWHSIISADAGYSISGQPIAISGLDEDVFGEIYLASLAEGKYPNAANEIAVSSVLKESNDLDLGSVIDLTCPDGSTVSFSIVGFLIILKSKTDRRKRTKCNISTRGIYHFYICF